MADPQSKAIRDFGLLDERYRPANWAYGVAQPIILVIDADGVVTHRFSDRAYWSRPPIEKVLAVLRADASN